MLSLGRRWLMLGVFGLGCGPSIAPGGDSDAGADGDDTTTASAADGREDGAPPMPGTTASPSTTGVGDTEDPGSTFGDEAPDPDTGDSFIGNPDIICGQVPDGYSAHCTWCDTWAQDCARGEKCMPWANDGGNQWTATRCSEIEDDPDAIGEPCTVQGSAVSGLDSCELGSMCFYVEPETLQGTCIAMCQGSEDDPSCPADTTCLMSGQGSLNLCLPTCDPLAGACPASQVCQPVNADFFCVPSSQEQVGSGAACDYIGDCESGLGCVPAAFVMGCATESCCSPFCDLDDGEPNPACAIGETCAAWYEDGSAPAGLEHVGVCTQ